MTLVGLWGLVAVTFFLVWIEDWWTHRRDIKRRYDTFRNRSEPRNP